VCVSCSPLQIPVLAKDFAFDHAVLDMKGFKSIQAQDEHRMLIWVHMKSWTRKVFYFKLFKMHFFEVLFLLYVSEVHKTDSMIPYERINKFCKIYI